MTIIIATATRQGTTEANNADAAAHFTLQDGTVGAALIDIIGHQDAAPHVGMLLAETAARIAPQRGGPAGLLSAALLIADPGAADDPEPSGAAVVAVVHPGEGAVISWIGDSHGYGWNGTTLTRYTTPHTYGEQLRQNGAPWDLAEQHDNWLTTTLARATPAGIFTVVADAPLIILTSDGTDCIPLDELTALVREHADDPQVLADAIVAAAREDDDSYRDDATVIVISNPAA